MDLWASNKSVSWNQWRRCIPSLLGYSFAALLLEEGGLPSAISSRGRTTLSGGLSPRPTPSFVPPRRNPPSL